MLSFLKIELFFLMFYNVHTSKKTIPEAIRTVSDGMTFHYKAIRSLILESLLTATRLRGA